MSIPVPVKHRKTSTVEPQPQTGHSGTAGLRFLLEAARRLGGSLDPGNLLDRMADLFTNDLRLADFRISLCRKRKGERHRLRTVRASGLLGTNLAGQARRTERQLIHQNPARSGRRRIGGSGLSPDFRGIMLCLPLARKGRRIGFVSVLFRPPAEPDRETANLLRSLCEFSAMALSNAARYQAARERSLTDPLTGLLNRRALWLRLEHEVARSRRFGLPLAVLVLDVDGFKAINDRRGHRMGDRVLVEVAAVLRAGVRKIDAVARLGGDEFCIILPETGEEQGMLVAEKLIASVEKTDLQDPVGRGPGGVGISVGVAELARQVPGQPGRSCTGDLLDAADRAMYRAKRWGRRRARRASRQGDPAQVDSE